MATMYYKVVMPSPIAFRPNDTDKKMLDFLKKKLALSASSVIRLAVKRLFDAEKAG